MYWFGLVLSSVSRRSLTWCVCIRLGILCLRLCFGIVSWLVRYRFGRRGGSFGRWYGKDFYFYFLEDESLEGFIFLFKLVISVES